MINKESINISLYVCIIITMCVLEIARNLLPIKNTLNYCNTFDGVSSNYECPL
jgi:hypothetical protein